MNQYLNPLLCVVWDQYMIDQYLIDAYNELRSAIIVCGDYWYVFMKSQNIAQHRWLSWQDKYCIEADMNSLQERSIYFLCVDACLQAGHQTMLLLT